MDASASRLPAFLLCVSAVAASAPDFCTQHKCLAHYPLSTDAKDVSNNGMDGVNNEVSSIAGLDRISPLASEKGKEKIYY